MEEITIELDDEIADWLESAAATQMKSVSELVAGLIQERRASIRKMESNLARKILSSRDPD